MLIDSKYNYSKRDKRKENNCRQCGNNWILGGRCEDTSLHYYRIMDGKQVDVANATKEITIAYNVDFNHDEAPPKVLLATISCQLSNENDESNQATIP